MNVISPIELEPEPIEIDPRPCVCGYTIDQHRQVDTPEGPEFFCIDLPPDEMTLDELNDAFEQEIMLRTADLVRQWELADPRNRWRHTGEPPPSAGSGEDTSKLRAPMQPSRTPQSTIDAFWYVAGLGDVDHLARWLAQHPRDVVVLQKLWEAKHAGA
jgi:hypothetical protein